MADTLCISCKQTVRPRQHAISCDSCDRWQHRTCHTGKKCLYVFLIYGSNYLYGVENIVGNEEDYVAVLEAIKEKLQDPAVDNFVVDFEQSAWLTIRHVVPDAIIKGCAFHWTQAVWPNVQCQGLVTTYRRRQAVYHYIRQLMTLPFLPASHIRETFTALKLRANNPQLQALVRYMDRQWFQHAIFHPEDWSIFRRSVRTNNDVEGWHNRLNTAAKHGGCPFYVLVPDLKTEAEVVDIAVAADDLERDSNRRNSRLEEKIQTYWDQYMDSTLTTTHFLKSVAKLYGPSDNYYQATPSDP